MRVFLIKVELGLILKYIVIFICGSKLYSYNDMNRLQCDFTFNEKKVIDTGRYYFMKYNYFEVDKNHFGYISDDMFYYVQDSFSEIDSFSLYIRKLDGYKYDSIHKAIVMWQYEGCIFEGCYLPSFKPLSRLMLNMQILDMDYSPEWGYLVTSISPIYNSNILSAYPFFNYTKGEELNMYKEVYLCGHCSDIQFSQSHKNVYVACIDDGTLNNKYTFTRPKQKKKKDRLKFWKK
jgi:hypothetical protein